jgi:type III secretion protein R
MSQAMRELKATGRRVFLSLVPLLFGVVVLGHGSLAWAQKRGLNLNGLIEKGGNITERPLYLLAALTAMALVPFVLMMVTSFVKIAVVLSIVRQAIGTQQIPPTQVITGLAIIMTVYIMMPVGLDMNSAVTDKMLELNIKEIRLDDIDPDKVLAVSKAAQEPMRDFLIKHSHLKDRDMFYKLAWRMRKPRDRADLTDRDFAVVVPSFVISELKESFQIGFILFVPFLVVDMVVANILMALGMQMLSPTTISLPFKVLLFVLVDGWYLISRGLVMGYQ